MSGDELFALLRDTVANDQVCTANWLDMLTACGVHEGVDAATSQRIAERFMLRWFGVGDAEIE